MDGIEIYVARDADGSLSAYFKQPKYDGEIWYVKDGSQNLDDLSPLRLHRMMMHLDRDTIKPGECKVMVLSLGLQP